MNSLLKQLRLSATLLFVLAAALHASAQQGLRQTFGPGVEGEVGGIVLGNEMQRKVVDQGVFPLARCNDNTPAIFYYRPASRPADADKWVINLQGGGACGNGLDCSQRWFSINQHFGVGGMTSEGFPVAVNMNGIFERDAPYASMNPLDGYNQVFLHYCSSDSWTGTVDNAVVAGLDYRPVLQDPVNGVAVPRVYTLSFLGRPIFDAVIETLRRQRGLPALVYRRPDGRSQPMPDLDEASFVILSGGSAGGAGVIHNLDHLRGILRERTRLVGLIDSIFRPSKDGMDLSQTTLCVNQGACTVDAQNQFLFNQGQYANWGAAQASDQSCLLYHFADPHQCADNRHLLTDHVTTPYFVRMDLLDPGALEDYQGDNLFMAGAPDPDPLTPEHEPLSAFEFATALRADILALADVPRTAHERRFMDFTPGAFSPACIQHDELRANTGVYLTAITRRSHDVRMYDVFRAWLHNDDRPFILAAEADRSDSICPE